MDFKKYIKETLDEMDEEELSETLSEEEFSETISETVMESYSISDTLDPDISSEERTALVSEYNQYINSIKNFAPLDDETLNYLGEILLKHKPDGRLNRKHPEVNAAIEMLANHHAKYVVSRALSLKRPEYKTVSIMTVIQEGNLGLLEAIEKWDYRKGKLTTFSRKYIDGRIKKLFPVSLPDNKDEAKFILDSLPDDAARKRKMYKWLKEYQRRQIEEKAINLEASLSEDSEETQDSRIAGKSNPYSASEIINHMDTYQKLRQLKFENPIHQKILKQILLGTKRNRIMENLQLNSSEYDSYHTEIWKIVSEELSKITLDIPSSQEIKHLYELIQSVPSGETIWLNQTQNDYASLFQFEEKSHISKPLPLWRFNEETFSTSNEKTILFEEFRKMKSVACYKYVVRFLLNIFQIDIGPHNETVLWDYLDSNWRLQQKTDFTFEKEVAFSCEGIEFESLHCAALMALLYKLVKKAYEVHHMELSTTAFKKLILFDNANTSELLNIFALIFHMKEEVYYIFREKVARIRRKDFLDQNFVLTLIVLKYADQCEITNWVSAFLTLKDLYPLADDKPIDNIPSDITNTIALGNEIVINLEENGKLKTCYQESLFTTPIEALKDFFHQEIVLKNSKALRTFEEEFMYQWNLLKKVLTSEESTLINISEQERKGKNDDVKYIVDSHKIQKFLYGNDVLGAKMTASKLKAAKIDFDDSFLNSKEFENTFIDDNTIMQFGSVGNAKRRNILLTILFLNFSYDIHSPKLQSLSYQQRVHLFQNRVVEPFVRCGFLPFHPSVGYDAFLKLLLTCSNPLDLFRYIWKLKIDMVVKNE